MTLKRYTLPAIAPVAGSTSGGTGSIVTFIDVAPAGGTNALAAAMSWACGGCSVVNAANARLAAPSSPGDPSYDVGSPAWPVSGVRYRYGSSVGTPSYRGAELGLVSWAASASAAPSPSATSALGGSASR